MGPLRLTIAGPPRTKKTSNRILRFGSLNKVVPSEQYLEWRDAAVVQLFKQRLLATTERVPCGACEGAGSLMVGKKKMRRLACPRCKGFAWQAPPLTRDVNCCALVYRDRASGDLVGFLQGIADALQDAGVVMDDKIIVGWDGSRPLKDAARPRVEVELVGIGDLDLLEPQQAAG